MRCPKCGIDMKVEEKIEKQIFKGKKIKLEYRVFVCPNCKESFVDVESLQNSWKKAWKEIGVPTHEELKNAREALEITGEELSKVMGRTKSLISKLENGTRRPSDKVLKFYEKCVIPGPREFLQALEKAFHEKRITQKEYEDIKCKIEKKLDYDIEENTIDKKVKIIKREHGIKPSVYNGEALFSKKKFLSIIRLIMRMKKSLNKMTLFKLLFYIDAEHFEHYGVALTGLRYMANLYGPTPFDYDLILSFLKEAKVLKEDDGKYVSVENDDAIVDLDENMKEFILKVLDVYDHDATELSKMSHREQAWKETDQKKIIIFHKEMIRTRI